MERKVYLDNAATTYVSSEVLQKCYLALIVSMETAILFMDMEEKQAQSLIEQEIELQMLSTQKKQ